MFLTNDRFILVLFILNSPKSNSIKTAIMSTITKPCSQILDVAKIGKHIQKEIGIALTWLASGKIAVNFSHNSSSS